MNTLVSITYGIGILALVACLVIQVVMFVLEKFKKD
jgi:hypothetical protein